MSIPTHKPALNQALRLRDHGSLGPQRGVISYILNLTWVTSTNGTLILSKTTGFPANNLDGTIVYQGGSATTIDLGLANGTPYFYAAFAYDGYGNFASGVTATATPNGDGSTWTARTLPSSQTWQGVVYGNGTFVAVASGPGTAAATSAAGVAWTARTLPSSQDWESVTYGNGTFVATARGPTTAAATSPDGITWTTRTMSSSQHWYSVTNSFVKIKPIPALKQALQFKYEGPLS